MMKMLKFFLIECLLGTNHLGTIDLFNGYTSPMKYYYDSQFTDKETEVQKTYATGFQLHTL
jgi:hypothetical protein